MSSATAARSQQSIEEKNRAAKIFTLYRHRAYLQRMVEDLDKFPEAELVKQDFLKTLRDIETVKNRLEV
jgi:hypothetical protein